MWPAMDELMFIDEDENVFISANETQFLRSKATAIGRDCPIVANTNASDSGVIPKPSINNDLRPVPVQVEKSESVPLGTSTPTVKMLALTPKVQTPSKSESPKNSRSSTKQLKEIASVLDK